MRIIDEELKAQKKEKKEKKKRKREADNLSQDNTAFEGGQDRELEKNRLRAYSGDFDEKPSNDGDQQPSAKRLRTRSMDKAEDNAKVVQAEKSQSTEEWRKSHNITVQGYGKNASQKFEDPFIEFNDAPFNASIQKTLKAAGFERPTFIQSQVSSREMARACVVYRHSSQSFSRQGMANCNSRQRLDFYRQNWIRKDLRLLAAVFPPIHTGQRDGRSRSR